jgi:hypothetical protein
VSVYGVGIIVCRDVFCSCLFLSRVHERRFWDVCEIPQAVHDGDISLVVFGHSSFDTITIFI